MSTPLQFLDEAELGRVLQSITMNPLDVVLSVGSPGVDTSIPTERAVRSAISATAASITGGTGIAVSPSPITTTGTIGLAAVGARTVLANTTASSAAPLPADRGVFFEQIIGNGTAANGSYMVQRTAANTWVLQTYTVPTTITGAAWTTAFTPAAPAAPFHQPANPTSQTGANHFARIYSHLMWLDANKSNNAGTVTSVAGVANRTNITGTATTTPIVDVHTNLVPAHPALANRALITNGTAATTANIWATPARLMEMIASGQTTANNTSYTISRGASATEWTVAPLPAGVTVGSLTTGATAQTAITSPGVSFSTNIVLHNVARTGNWTDILGRPTTFPPAAHDHDIRYVRYDAAQTITAAQGAQLLNNIMSTAPTAAVTQAARWRTALGLGTAAVANTGTANGNVPVLDANGRLAESVMPNLAITDFHPVDTIAGATNSRDSLTVGPGGQVQRGDIAFVSANTTDPNLNGAWMFIGAAGSTTNTAAQWRQLSFPTNNLDNAIGRLPIASLANGASAAQFLITGTTPFTPTWTTGGTAGQSPRRNTANTGIEWFTPVGGDHNHDTRYPRMDAARALSLTEAQQLLANLGDVSVTVAGTLTAAHGTNIRTGIGAAPIAHAVNATTHGIPTLVNYGHIRMSSAGTATGTNTTADAAWTNQALTNVYTIAATTVDLNTFRQTGEWIWRFVNPASTGFPADFGFTGAATATTPENACHLKVIRYSSTTTNTWITQTLRKQSDNSEWIRHSNSAASLTWSDWERADAEGVIGDTEDWENLLATTPPPPVGPASLTGISMRAARADHTHEGAEEGDWTPLTHIQNPHTADAPNNIHVPRITAAGQGGRTLVSSNVLNGMPEWIQIEPSRAVAQISGNIGFRITTNITVGTIGLLRVSIQAAGTNNEAERYRETELIAFVGATEVTAGTFVQYNKGFPFGRAVIYQTGGVWNLYVPNASNGPRYVQLSVNVTLEPIATALTVVPLTNVSLPNRCTAITALATGSMAAIATSPGYMRVPANRFNNVVLPIHTAGITRHVVVDADPNRNTTTSFTLDGMSRAQAYSSIQEVLDAVPRSTSLTLNIGRGLTNVTGIGTAVVNSWVAATAYATGDRCISEGYVFEATAPVTGGIQPSIAVPQPSWQHVNLTEATVQPNTPWRGAWSATETYVIGDIVTHNNLTYVRVRSATNPANESNEPSPHMHHTFPTIWVACGAHNPIVTSPTNGASGTVTISEFSRLTISSVDIGATTGGSVRIIFTGSLVLSNNGSVVINRPLTVGGTLTANNVRYLHSAPAESSLPTSAVAGHPEDNRGLRANLVTCTYCAVARFESTLKVHTASTWSHLGQLRAASVVVGAAFALTNVGSVRFDRTYITGLFTPTDISALYMGGGTLEVSLAGATLLRVGLCQLEGPVVSSGIISIGSGTRFNSIGPVTCTLPAVANSGFVVQTQGELILNGTTIVNGFAGVNTGAGISVLTGGRARINAAFTTNGSRDSIRTASRGVVDVCGPITTNVGTNTDAGANRTKTLNVAADSLVNIWPGTAITRGTGVINDRVTATGSLIDNRASLLHSADHVTVLASSTAAATAAKVVDSIVGAQSPPAHGAEHIVTFTVQNTAATELTLNVRSGTSGGTAGPLWFNNNGVLTQLNSAANNALLRANVPYRVRYQAARDTSDTLIRAHRWIIMGAYTPPFSSSTTDFLRRDGTWATIDVSADSHNHDTRYPRMDGVAPLSAAQQNQFLNNLGSNTPSIAAPLVPGNQDNIRALIAAAPATHVSAVATRTDLGHTRLSSNRGTGASNEPANNDAQGLVADAAVRYHMHDSAASINLNNYRGAGEWAFRTSATPGTWTNCPFAPAGTTGMTLKVYKHVGTNTHVTQVLRRSVTAVAGTRIAPVEVWTRSSTAAGTWSQWQRIDDSVNTQSGGDNLATPTDASIQHLRFWTGTIAQYNAIPVGNRDPRTLYICK
jgi:hypothetical protein